MNGPPGDDERRLSDELRAASNVEVPDDDRLILSRTPAELRRRRAAALRCAPFDDAGHRDDLDILADEVRHVVPWQKFGLTEEQRRRHGNDLVTRWQWTVEEVEQVLGVRPRVAA